MDKLPPSFLPLIVEELTLQIETITLVTVICQGGPNGPYFLSPEIATPGTKPWVFLIAGNYDEWMPLITDGETAYPVDIFYPTYPKRQYPEIETKTGRKIFRCIEGRQLAVSPIEWATIQKTSKDYLSKL